MKKLKRVSIVILVITTILMIGFNVIEFVRTDTKPPVVTCPEDVLEVSVTTGEEELLQGVQAVDKRSGDISDVIVVEKISAMEKDGSMTITYAAADEAGNVGRTERKLKYVDYDKPRLYLTDSLRFPVDKIPRNWAENIHADSVLDGDLSNSIKYQILDENFNIKEGLKNIAVWVTDSVGTQVSFPFVFEIYDENTETIKVELEEYLIYMHVNENFDPQSFFKEASVEGELSIQSSVDMTTPGVYYVDYIVEKDSLKGKNRLIVVVEE